MLLMAQCNALHAAMPFLFERIDDETELLLPETLLHSDSLIRKLVNGIDEEDWQEVEIIGWLYQFYISEKKDQVIGKVVKSEEIRGHAALYAELDREVSGAEQSGQTMAGDVSGLANQAADGVLH